MIRLRKPRRHHIGDRFSWVLLWVLAYWVQPGIAAGRPNVVLIMADDLGARDLACYGSDLHETPVLDDLAKHGIRFEHAYAPSPVCSPTRASLMTGLHPARLGITIWSEGARKPDRTRRLLPADSLDHLPLKYVTLAEKLGSAGYRTAAVGKWHLGDGDMAAETQGFEVAVGGTRWGAAPSFFWPFKNDTRFRDEFRYVPGLPFGKKGDYLTDILTDAALRVIDDAGEEPFFLYLAHYAPHTPIEAPAGLVAKYQGKIREGLRHGNSTYAAMIENLDTNVGRLIEHLKAKGKFENTLMIFASDNGGYLGDPKGRNGEVTTNAPLRGGKGSLYEGGIRVPLILKLPDCASSKGSNTESARTITDRAVLTDLHRVILKLAGIEDLARGDVLDGVDWSANLVDPNAPWPSRTFYFHYPHYYETTTPVSGLIEGGHKLLHHAGDGRTELYDLRSDPSEKQDLSVKEPKKAAELLERLKRWKIRIGAGEAVPNPDFGKGAGK